MTTAPRVKLVVLLDGRRVGEVLQTGSRYAFRYTESWRNDPDAYPLSLSMTMAGVEHPHRAITAFMWGLLPDNSRILERYGRLFGVSPRNPVALLTHIGADCAGAVQFVVPERADEYLGGPTTKVSAEWLSEVEIGTTLRSARESGLPGSDARTTGRFSLAGAQPKVALLEHQGRWGRPTGRTPTNRILKPPAAELPGFAENEHVCLELARELNLGATRSRVMTFDGERAIVIDRFDRLQVAGVLRRVHQEDCCQALGVLPDNKYESDGGPGISMIVGLLRQSSQQPVDDVNRFLDAVLLNWVLAGTDAHAKNYALLLGSDGGVRLAPFYDIASLLPYEDRRLHRVRLAMQIGGEYLIRHIGRKHWRELAGQNGLHHDALLGRAGDLLTRLPDALNKVAGLAIAAGLAPKVIRGLAARIRERVSQCRKELG